MPVQDKLKEYDSEPVRYCPRCFSLKIRYEDAIGSDCCMDCGCSDIAETSIEEWERMYEERYGSTYISHEKNIRDTPIFKCSLEQLKTKVYNSMSYREIIRRMYPSFPGGLSRIDSVLLFFDRLCKDGRIDELRINMLNT